MDWFAGLHEIMQLMRPLMGFAAPGRKMREVGGLAGPCLFEQGSLCR